MLFSLNEYTLTNHQEEAISRLSDFLESDCACFILKGYAGTGKTFLTKIIADQLESEGYAVQLLAPTGRAARVLSNKSGHNATTIHRAIYNLKELKEEKTNSSGKIKFKFRYEIQHIEENIRNVYLIDESSMISDKYAEGDFFIFGSGRLLNDIFTFVGPTNTKRKDKIIFIGDPAQLPPVSDSQSGALDAEYLRMMHQVDSMEFEMTEVVRQSRESGILFNANYIREQLSKEKSVRLNFDLQSNFPDVHKLDTAQVVDRYLVQNESLLTDQSIIVNHSNKSCLKHNLAVRERIFPDKYKIALNDLLMINQNNYNYNIELFNGTMVKILAVSDAPEVKSNMKSYDAEGEVCRVTHKFRRVTIAVDGDERQEVSCLILDNFLYSPNPSLDYAENIALYLDFKIRHPNLKPGTKPFSDSLRSDPYFNALRLKFGYAVTCHKAQGGEWRSAIVNMDVNQGKRSDAFLRWTYTALTRASEQLYYFNFTRESQFSRMVYSDLKLNESVEEDARLMFEITDDVKILVSKLGLDGVEPFIKQRFIEILAIARNQGVDVTIRESHTYQEIYTFKKEEQIAKLQFWYDGKNRFTKIGVVVENGLSEELGNRLRELFDKPFSITIQEAHSDYHVEEFLNEDSPETLFPVGKDATRNLYDQLYPRISKMHIGIIQVKHGEYHDFYSLKRGSESAIIQFYYDGLNRYTKSQPVISQCNSNKLLEDVAACIHSMIDDNK
jgi:tRNA A37 threonylcarbamoyladenosine biosynthesis protein TsaE